MHRQSRAHGRPGPRGLASSWAAAIVAAALLAYLPALDGGFIGDDTSFITEHPLVNAPTGCTASGVPARRPTTFR